jgi:kinetochore protein Mis13/DSN1
MDQNLNPAFNFSHHSPQTHESEGDGVKKKKKGKAKEVIMDTSAPIEQDETPQIQRNKRLREGAMASITSDREDDAEEDGGEKRAGRGKEKRTDRRRSSLSRGKRISSGFDLTGIICEFVFSFLLFVSGAC